LEPLQRIGTILVEIGYCPSINGYFPQSLRLPVRSTQTGQTQILIFKIQGVFLCLTSPSRKEKIKKIDYLQRIFVTEEMP